MKRKIYNKLLDWKDSTLFYDMEITKSQYEYALNRIEELLPLVTDLTPANDKYAVELTIVSDIVEAYEKIHYALPEPSVLSSELHPPQS